LTVGPTISVSNRSRSDRPEIFAGVAVNPRCSAFG
jgi:hypothetical protein